MTKKEINLLEELELLVDSHEDDFDRGKGKYIIRKFIQDYLKHPASLVKGIKTYRISEGCFGEELIVDGKKYDSIPRDERMSFVVRMLEDDVNADSLLYDVFLLCLSHLQLELKNSEYYTCEGCGNTNYFAEYGE